MRTLISLTILLPLLSLGQVFETFTGPPIFLSKKYIQDNKIKCLTFSETRGHSKNKPYSSAKYNLVFDSTGMLVKMKSFDTLKLPDDFTQYLCDYVDTTDQRKHYDTIFYDKNNNVIKRTRYEYKDYYSYDIKNRLSEIITITPQADSGPFLNKLKFIYGNGDKLIELVKQRGKFNYKDFAAQVYITYSFKYTKDLLTSIRHTHYKDNKVDYSYDINIDYIDGVISKIVHVDKEMKDYLTIDISKCE